MGTPAPTTNIDPLDTDAARVTEDTFGIRFQPAGVAGWVGVCFVTPAGVRKGRFAIVPEAELPALASREGQTALARLVGAIKPPLPTPASISSP